LSHSFFLADLGATEPLISPALTCCPPARETSCLYGERWAKPEASASAGEGLAGEGLKDEDLTGEGLTGDAKAFSLPEGVLCSRFVSTRLALPLPAGYPVDDDRVDARSGSASTRATTVRYLSRWPAEAGAPNSARSPFRSP